MSRFASLNRLHFVLWLVLFTQACSVNYIADYDEVTDRTLMDLQRKFSTFFVQLEDKIGTPEAAYDLHRGFYQEIKVDISALSTRVEAMPLNEFTSKSIGLLSDNVVLLESLHKEGIGTMEVLALVKEDFNRNIVNILRLELAKKRGDH